MELYLYQVATWIEKTIGIKQQIIHTKDNNKIRYTDYDSDSGPTHMTLIADADICIESVSWSDEFGLGLNVDHRGNENGEKVHVLLWSDSELKTNEHGHYLDFGEAVNGILVIQNPDIKLTSYIISEMLTMPKSLRGNE